MIAGGHSGHARSKAATTRWKARAMHLDLLLPTYVIFVGADQSPTEEQLVLPVSRSSKQPLISQRE